MEAVQVRHLSKSYEKDKTAVNDVSFSVNQNEIFGLIGPDGAGKSSIFRMLTTLILPDSGNASVNGFDIVRDYKTIRSRVGYMPGKFSLYPDLSVEENLNFFATVFNTTVRENYHLIEGIYRQLEPFKDRRAGKLSGGMKQKLALCCAQIHKPEVLFLDEPTTGVDPVSRKEFWEMLKHLKEQEISILVSTPYMDEAILCDRIALIQEGHILSVDTPSKMISDYSEQLYAVRSGAMYKLLQTLKNYPLVLSSYAFGEYAHVSFRDPEVDLKQVEIYLRDQGLEDIEIRKSSPGIEDIFIKLLKH